MHVRIDPMGERVGPGVGSDFRDLFLIAEVPRTHRANLFFHRQSDTGHMLQKKIMDKPCYSFIAGLIAISWSFLNIPKD